MIQDTVCRILGYSIQLQDTGYSIQDTRIQHTITGYRIQYTGYRILGYSI